MSNEPERETHAQKFTLLSKTFELSTNPALQSMAEQLITDYDVITNVYNSIKLEEPRSNFVIIPMVVDIKDTFDQLASAMTKYVDIKGFEFRKIPWFKLSLADTYDCPHGEEYKDVYVFFLSAQDLSMNLIIRALKDYKKPEVE